MNKQNKIALVALILAASASASAELPTAATDALTGVSTDGAALLAAGWPVLAAITGGFILMKLFKKVINRAT